jgi:hypothetical protein
MPAGTTRSPVPDVVSVSAERRHPRARCAAGAAVLLFCWTVQRLCRPAQFAASGLSTGPETPRRSTPRLEGTTRSPVPDVVSVSAERRHPRARCAAGAAVLLFREKELTTIHRSRRAFGDLRASRGANPCREWSRRTSPVPDVVSVSAERRHPRARCAAGAAVLLFHTGCLAFTLSGGPSIPSLLDGAAALPAGAVCGFGVVNGT